MKRFLIGAVVAGTTFILGVAFAGIWITKRQSVPITQTVPKKCTPVYDASLVKNAIATNDLPDLYGAFQELPLYAMPHCVDEPIH
jgi:hypothetical protein